MEVLTKNLTVLAHPVIKHNLALIRDKKSNTDTFKCALKRITYALILEASKSIPLMETKVETPLEVTTCETFDESSQVIIAPILRAGLAFSEVAQELLPFANVHHIGMYRNEQTLEPVWYYDKKKEIKKDKKKVHLLILDPMLATGNSAIDTIKNFLNKGVEEKNITFVSLISSPEGVKKITGLFPEVRIVTASLDKGLNSKGYILPGLGDAGDRIFNTVE